MNESEPLIRCRDVDIFCQKSQSMFAMMSATRTCLLVAWQAGYSLRSWFPLRYGTGGM